MVLIHVVWLLVHVVVGFRGLVSTSLRLCVFCRLLRVSVAIVGVDVAHLLCAVRLFLVVVSHVRAVV